MNVIRQQIMIKFGISRFCTTKAYFLFVRSLGLDFYGIKYIYCFALMVNIRKIIYDVI